MRSIAARGAVTVLWAKVLSVILAQTGAVVLPLFLQPDDFGIFGVVIFFVGLVVLIGDFGFGTELIRRTERIDDALATAFSIRIILGFVLLGASVGIGFVIAIFYRDSRLFLATIVASLALMIGVGTLVPRTLALRALNFKLAILPDQLGKIALAVSAISLAVLGWGYWSLVFASLVGPSVAVISYRRLVPWHVGWQIDREIGKTIVNFGKFVTLGALAVFVANSVDKLIIGYALGLTQLGYYFLAYSWAVGVPSSLQSILGGVTYPIFGKLKGEPERLRRALSEMFRLFSYMGVFVAFGIVAISDPFVGLVLGSQWAPAVMPMRILSAAGFSLGWVLISGDALNAIGKPRLVTWMHALGLALVSFTLYPLAILFGLVGAASSVSLGLVTLAALSRLLVNRELHADLGTQLKVELLIPLASGLLAVLSSWAAGLALPLSLFGLVLRFGIFVAVYVVSMQMITRQRFLTELWSVTRMALRRSD